MVLLAASNLSDLYDYRGAAADGRALVANIVDDVRPDPATTTVLVGPRRDDGRAVEQFILNNDLWSALRLRHGAQWLTTHMPVSRADCERLATKAEDAGRTVLAYDQVSRTLTRYGEASSCGTTARLAGSDP